MNANRLMAHFERISDAPDAVERLRRFILDLAVRGKLVEQDPGDEPAEVLLERIAAKKTELSSRVKTRTTAVIESDPYPLPPSWAWTQIADLGLLSPRNNADNGVVCSFVPMSLISAAYGIDSSHEKRAWGEIKKGYTHIADGDVAVAKITPCFENGKSTVFRNLTGGIGAGTTELHVVRPIEVSPDYIVLFLKSPFFIENGIPRMTGTAGQKRLPSDYFAYRPFPLPPLAEQHRIVEKVDELMKLCDQLEACQKERESRRDRLVVASLNRLSQPTDPDEFRKDAGFQLSNLNRLSTKPEHIKELRKAILNLAFTNGLTPLRGVSEKVSVGEVAQLQNGYAFKSQWFKPKGIRLLRNANVGHGHLDWTEAVCLSPEQAGEYERFELRAGDIVLSLDRPFISTGTKVARVAPEDLPSLLLQRVGRFIIQQDRLDADYLFRWLKSPLFAAQADPGRSLGVPHISSKNVENAEIRLPPLAEQKRIVAKVDELMLICDQLETQLEYQQKGRRQLLEALLHEALEGVG